MPKVEQPQMDGLRLTNAVYPQPGVTNEFFYIWEHPLTGAIYHHVVEVDGVPCSQWHCTLPQTETQETEHDEKPF